MKLCRTLYIAYHLSEVQKREWIKEERKPMLTGWVPNRKCVT